MTSATLVVKDSFKYFKEQLGLENEPMQTASLPSPFPYKELVKVLVPNDLPDINCLSVEEFSETAANHIIAAAQAAKGRMMVLFTSHEMLRATYHSIKDSGVLDEFTLFAGDFWRKPDEAAQEFPKLRESRPVWDNQPMGRRRYPRRGFILFNHCQASFFATG